MTLPLVTALDVLKELDRIYPLDEFIYQVRQADGNEMELRPEGPLVNRWIDAVDRMRELFREAGR